MQLSLSTAIVALAALVGTVLGSTHTVHFVNNCGSGSPILIEGNEIRSTGADYTSDGPITGAIAYLQDGSCGTRGEGCTLVDTTLANRNVSSGGSSTKFDLSGFNVPAGFSYVNGCNGVGATCANEKCPEQDVTIVCQADNVGLTITFCSEAS